MESMKYAKINLTIYGGKLYLDPDSLISVSIYSHLTKRFTECCRIESALYENNPNWPTTIKLDYIFELVQPINFTIKSQTGSEILNFASTLAELSRKGKTTFEVPEESRVKKLKVTVKEEKSLEETVTLHFKAHNVDKMDFFGKSDPYFILSKSINNTWVQVYKSEIVKKTLDPIWKPFSLNSKQLCENNHSLALKIEVYDWDMGTKDDFIGGFEFTYQQLSNKNCRFEIINKKKQKKKKKYSNSGIFEVSNFQVLKNLTFIDYLMSGVKVCTVFGIDFTLSNEEYTKLTSLHNLQNENSYERLLISLASILEQYDHSKFFSLFGFGAEPNWLKKLSHCFALNQSNISPFVHGVQNVVDTYKAAVQSVRFSGPTIVSQVINAANSLSCNFECDKTYNVLIIIIDNEINDMYQTMSSIVQSSFLPLSVIFVAVGNQSFNGLHQLLEFPLSDESGKKSLRKNVQLAVLRDFGNDANSLASEVLKKIPKELEEFMNLIHYFP